MKTVHFVVATVVLNAVSFAQLNLMVADSRAAKTSPAPNLVPADPARRGQIIEDYGKIPLSFEANQGQTDSRVKFLSHGSGYTLFLTGNEAVVSLPRREKGKEVVADRPSLAHRHELGSTRHSASSTLVKMKLAKAAAAARVSGEDELPGKSNFFIGNDPKKWHANVPTYAKVRYQEIYPGIDLVYYGNQQQLEYDFVVSPGADPHHIEFEVRRQNSPG